MEITSVQLKELRDMTGISVMQCKKALEEAGGDMEKAVIILKKKRSEAADKKSDREIGAGAIGSYVHNTNEVRGARSRYRDACGCHQPDLYH
jgi:elongation factor Ts